MTLLRLSGAALLSLAASDAAWGASLRAVDLPAGTLGQAVAALGRQAGVSIAVNDARLWRRPVAAVRGRMDAGQALRRLLRGTGAAAVPLGEAGWRVEAARPIRFARATPPPVPPTPQMIADAAEEPVIVVTASKRDVPLGGYPGTASLLDGADLALGGERGTESILARLASVSSTHLGAGRNKLFIRGIADSSFTGPTQATVGQYLGDVRMTYNAPDPDLRLYDIAAVEVLEGPQGTLYGAGSLGGIIRFARNAPQLVEAGGSVVAGVSATAHGAPGADIGATLNLPLAEDRAGLRLVGYGITEGGYIDNRLSGEANINRTRIGGGRATLRLASDDGWTVDLGGTLQLTDGEDSQYADRDAPPLTRASRLPQGFSAHYALGELVLRKEWDTLRFQSSSGVVSQKLSERFDASMPNGPTRLFRQRNETRMFSSESRLWRPVKDGWGWVLGASVIQNRTRLSRNLGAPQAPPPAPGVTNRITEGTLYGEASIEPIRGLSITAGGRVTHAKLSGEAQDIVSPVLASPIIQQVRAQIVASRKETTVLPSFSVAADMLPGVTLFARYQQGFRPGGLAIEGDYVRRFRNDRVRTVETGLRVGRPGRDAFDFTGSLSNTQWRDIQADFIDATGLPSTANIGDGRIWSVSATAGWQPAPGLRLDLGGAFNDGRVTDPTQLLRTVLAAQAEANGVPLGSSGMSRVPNVARFAVRAGADYRAVIGDDMDLHLFATARYVGKSRLGIGPVLGEEQGDYLDTQLTGRIGWRGFGLTLGITNLTDEVGNRFALGTPFFSGQARQVTPLRPRTLRIALDAAF